MKIYRNVYLDYAATTPVLETVFEEMLPYLREKFGNPSSIHKFGQESRTAIEIARDDIARLINAKPSEIYFTSCGTEAINFALKGSARILKDEYNKDEIITSKVEHHAVLETCKYLEKEGFKVTYLTPNKSGTISPKQIEKFISNRTGIVSIIHINNETGAINDINSIGEITRRNNIIFHVDAVQSFGKLRFNLNKSGIDLLSASAHKIYGPKGAGLLYIRTGTPITSILHGGSQERNRRGGTENVAGIIGFAKAAKIAYQNLEENFHKVQKIKNYFIDKLKSFGDKILFNSPLEKCSPYILNISLNPEYFTIDENTLIMNFAIRGVAVSSGSACTSGVLEASHVLLAMGYDIRRASTAVRFSFSPDTTFDEIDYTIEVIKDIIHLLQNK